MCSQWCGHPSSAATWKSEIRIQRGRWLSRLSGSVFSPQWYGDANALWCLWKRRYCNCLPPGQGCPSAVRAPALSQSDWWMSRSGQSFKLRPALAKGLGPTRSLSISHIILLVLACLGQRFHPRKASWSRVKAKLVLRVSQSIRIFVGIANYSFCGLDRAASPITGVILAQEIKAKWANAVVFLSEKNCYLLLPILLTFGVVGWITQVEEPDVRLTIINNGAEQGPASLTSPRDSQPPKSDERSPGAQGHSSNGPP